jgi:hypothetical protein
MVGMLVVVVVGMVVGHGGDVGGDRFTEMPNILKCFIFLTHFLI